jgi:hypothetical protein
VECALLGLAMFIQSLFGVGCRLFPGCPPPCQQKGADFLEMPGKAKDREQDRHHQQRAAETQLKHVRISVNNERENRARENKAQPTGKKDNMRNQLPPGQIKRRIMPQAFPICVLDEDNCSQQNDFIAARYELLKLDQLPEDRNPIPEDHDHSGNFNGEENHIDEQKRSAFQSVQINGPCW